MLFWFAIDIVESAELAAIISRGPPVETMVTITDKLREEGLEVAHLISIGGWNEVHPFTDAGAAAAFQAFKHWNEHDMARPELGFYGFDGLVKLVTRLQCGTASSVGRIGDSDFDVNKKRMNYISAALDARGWKAPPL